MNSTQGSKEMHRMSSRNLTFWSLFFTVIAIATMPIIIGYVFGTAAVICGSIVIGREWKSDRYEWVAYGAWVTTTVSFCAMVGYLIYMMGFANNYLS